MMDTVNLLPIKWLIIVAIVIQGSETFFLEEDDYDNYEHYIAVPVNLDHHGDTQYMHVYITASTDTKVAITLHDTYLYRAASLTRHNDWSWHESIYISPDLQKSAYAKGFDIVSNHPVTILITRNTSSNPMLITYTLFPLPKRQDAEFVVGSITSWDLAVSEFLVATGRNRTRISAYGPGSDAPTLSDLPIDPYTVYKYSVEEPRNVAGFRLTSSQPAAVYVSYTQLYDQVIGTFFYQTPSVDRLNRQHLVGPLSAHQTTDEYSVFLVVVEGNDSIRITHSMEQARLDVDGHGSSGSCHCLYTNSRVCEITCESALTPGSYLEVGDIRAEQVVLVECSSRCMVFVRVNGDEFGDIGRVLDSLLLVAPVGSLPNGAHFFVPFSYGQEHAQRAQVTIAVPKAAIDGLLVDGTPIVKLHSLLKYTTSSVSTWTVVVLALTPGNHRVIHEKAESVPISVHVRGLLMPMSCFGIQPSTFGYPAVFPEVTASAYEILEQSAVNAKRSISASNTAKQYRNFSVAGIILLTAVFLTVLAVVVIGIRNSALLRVIIYGQEISMEKQLKDTQTEKPHSELDEKVEIEAEEHENEERDGDMYLVPTTQRSRYERLAQKTAETNVDLTEVTYDTIT